MMYSMQSLAMLGRLTQLQILSQWKAIVSLHAAARLLCRKIEACSAEWRGVGVAEQGARGKEGGRRKGRAQVTILVVGWDRRATSPGWHPATLSSRSDGPARLRLSFAASSLQQLHDALHAKSVALLDF